MIDYQQTFAYEAEWMVDPSIFSKISKTSFFSDVDLIPTQKICAVEKYVSCQANPLAWA